jgi:glucose/arabinose dehydrogenase
MGVVVLAVAACGDIATLPSTAGMGPQPTLPDPQHTLVPTVHIAPAKGWPNGVTPQAARGMGVTAFARELDHPRWLYVLPNRCLTAWEKYLYESATYRVLVF